MQPVIEVEELRVRYRGAHRPAVDGVTFQVAPGEVFGFLGPNGAGKSTTQQVLTGQLPGYRGRAEVLGREVSTWGPDLFERVGVAFELPAHFPKLTVQENLATFAGLYRRPVMTPARALDLVDLGAVANQRAATLSKGMKMRLNLARALLHRPEVLFLDEPTAGLDPNHAAGVHDVIRNRAREGCTVFLTTHDMVTVDEVCDRVAFLHDGRIRAVDTPRNLRLAHGSPQVRVEFRDGDGLQHREFPLSTPTDPDLVALLRDVQVETIHSREASLREVFIAVTGGRL